MWMSLWFFFLLICLFSSKNFNVGFMLFGFSSGNGLVNKLYIPWSSFKKMLLIFNLMPIFLVFLLEGWVTLLWNLLLINWLSSSLVPWGMCCGVCQVLWGLCCNFVVISYSTGSGFLDYRAYFSTYVHSLSLLLHMVKKPKVPCCLSLIYLETFAH